MSSVTWSIGKTDRCESQQPSIHQLFILIRLFSQNDRREKEKHVHAKCRARLLHGSQ